jgi:hypothetical protein
LYRAGQIMLQSSGAVEKAEEQAQAAHPTRHRTHAVMTP